MGGAGSDRTDADQPLSLFAGLPIVVSKLVVPPLPQGFTPRPRVVNALTEDAAAICVVASPAGYGKTTATVEALTGDDPDGVAWLSVDSYDSTELSFWAHLLAAIEQVRPGLLQSLAESDGGTPDADGGQLAASLLAALESDDGLVIVLDDAHHIASRAVWEQLAFFLERLPTGIRVILTTRTTPPLPLERWQSQGRVTVLDDQILRFDVAEAEGLIAGVTERQVTPSEVAELVSRSEGWAVGLLFEALASRDPRTTDAAQSERGSRPSRTVINYLATEVLDTLSTDDREFLLSISILDEFDNDLCRRVTGEVDAGLRLRSLQVSNLFLVPVDEAAGRFRFHHLFRDLLLENLDRHDPGRRRELHLRAAEAAAARGDVLVRIRHLLEAGEQATAFELMAGFSLQAGSLAAARDIIARFSTDFVLDDPHRMLDFALVLGLAGDWVVAGQWCDRAEAALTEITGPLRARLAFHRALDFAAHGELQPALDSLDRCVTAAASSAGDDDTLTRLAFAVFVRIHVFFIRDQKMLSYWLDEGRKLPRENVPLHHVTIPALTAFLRLWEGDLQMAEQLGRQALAAADELAMPPGLPILEASLILIDVLIETGRLAEAESTLDRAEGLGAQVATPSHLVHIVLRRVELTAARHGPAAGADAARHASTRFKDWRLGKVLVDLLAASYSYWLLAEGRTIEASRLMDTIDPSPRRSILQAKLAEIEHRQEQVAMLLAEVEDWPAPERFEGELLRDAAGGCRNLPEILERADGYNWTIVKQGPSLFDRLASHPLGVSPAVSRFSDDGNEFSAAFLSSGGTEPGRLLTDRESSILKLLPSHLSYAAIADELYISVNTVKSNLKTLYRKLGASTRSEAVERASSADLI